MPIYLEHRGVVFAGSPFRHLYLVYVPEGEENNYSAYKTIGGFPQTDSTFGPWGLLQARYSNADLPIDETDDGYSIEGQADPRAWAEANRGSVEIYGSGGVHLEDYDVWLEMAAIADEISNQFTYIATKITGLSYFGPTTNSNSLAVSVMLHTEKKLGISFNLNQTDETAPGKLTFLGTGEADDMNLADARVQEAGMEALYGGKGADTLTADGLTSDATIVAGDDRDQDVILGGSGNDTIVGYYNQADLSGSDILQGGAGSDTFYIIDPVLTLAGGIPDLNQSPTASGTDFTHGGNVVGSGGLIDGGTGSGVDILDFKYVTGSVHLTLDVDHIRNIDEIKLSHLGDDYVEVKSIDGYGTIDGRQGKNTFSISESENGVTIASEPGFLDSTYRLESNDGLNALILKNFNIFQLTNSADEANFQQYDGDGALSPDGSPITVFAAGGLDVLTGSNGHDEIHGGLGDDIITGGAGADFIYDRGADDGIREGESLDQYVIRTLAYDGEGNDEIRAGDGSDILVYSGGTDTYYGGKGNDLYIANERAARSNAENDKATLVLGDEGADFGHDLIAGDGRWIDTVRFEGFNRSDVSITYDFEETPIGSDVFNVDFHFLSWWGVDADPKFLDHYITVGTVEIKVNETSSLTIENVVGYHTRGNNGEGITIAPSISVPFALQFDDGYLDWPNAVADSSTGNLNFTDGTLSDTAFAALGALHEERSVPSETIEGDQVADNDLYGSIEAEYVRGLGGNDRLFGGGAGDVLEGGEGADYLDGGSGIDTASYANSTSGVRMSVDGALSGATGEEVGDVLVSIENLTGSDFDDVLTGNDADNVLRGGLGNDVLKVESVSDVFLGLGTSPQTFDDRNNELYGGEGDDELFTSFGNNLLDGGAGNDTLRAWTGYDRMYGGDGDDLLINRGMTWTPFISGQGYVDIREAGNGIYDGGDGVDTFQSGSSMDAVIDLAAGQAVWEESGDWVTLISIENVDSGDGNDRIFGSDADNVLNGDDGDDVIYGGAGNDVLIGGAGNDILGGGSGVDTLRITALSSMATYDAVEGGIRITIAENDHPDYIFTLDEGTFIISDDIEFIEFDDVTLTYGEVAGPLLTEFAVIDDYFRFDEGGSSVVDFTANDLEVNADPISILTVNGTTMTTGTMIRLASGATLTMLADGQLEFDQGGAYAWLDPGQTAIETVTYTATDSSGVEKTGSVTLVVDGVESNPDALHLEHNAIVTTANPDKATKTSVANFNIAASIVVIDEVYVDPNDVPAGVTLEEINGDTYVLFGGDDAIVLEDISLEAWKHAAANLTMVPTDGDDVLAGDASANRLSGGDGDDFILGGAGDDSLSGSAGDDELFGGTGDDSLNGGDGDDLLRGGDGDDVLNGRRGQDTFDGGEGFDRVDLRNDYIGGYNDPGVYVNLNAGIVEWRNGQDGLEELISIEGVNGTNGTDILIGTEGDDYLDGNDGQNDLIYGGDGNDTLSANGDNSEMHGEAGDDELTGGVGDEIFIGGTGDDTMNGKRGDDIYRINLGDGNDVIWEALGNSYQDRIVFGAGITEDMITLSVSDSDGDGYDNLILSISGTTQTILIEDAFYWNNGDNGAVEFLEFADGSTVNLGELYAATLYQATSENDSYTGTNLSEVVHGLEGDDSLSGGNGNDTLLGGIGNDTLTGGNGDDALFGEGDNDTLNGGAGDDAYHGGAGDDLLIGSSGTDTFDGGSGTDTLDFSYTSNDVEIDLAAGMIEFEGGNEETVSEIENIIAGSGHNTLIGSDQANVIDGGAGHDTISGGVGDDTLTGGSDWDVFNFSDGDGQDIVTDFDSNSDFILLNGRAIDPTDLPSGVTIVAQGSDALITYGNNDSVLLTGVSVSDWANVAASPGDDLMTGTSAHETFYGGAGNDTIDGGEGDDNHYGGAGDDILRGSLGHDFFDGGDGNDTVDFSYTNSDLTLNLSASSVTFGALQRGHTEQILNFENIISGSGSDILTGTDGDNRIKGGAGTDILRGLDGADIYEYALGDGNDYIQDGGTDATEIDILRFAAGIDPEEVVAERLGEDIRLTLTATGEKIRLENALSDVPTSVDAVEFDDGTVWDYAELLYRSSPEFHNIDPTAVGDVATLSEDGTILIDVLENDSDEDGGALTIVAVEGAVNGTTVIEGGQIRYTPNADFNGSETLTYTVQDELGGTDTATVTVTVAPENDAPVAADETLALAEDGTVLIDALANDGDVDGDALTVTSVAGALNGAVVIEDGQIRYTPNADFHGSETLTYTVSDGNGETDTATVTITVTPENDAPEAADDTASLVKDGTILIDVLANDGDIDGDALTISGVTGAVNGTAMIENGQIRYTPNAGFSGEETLTYAVDDGNGGSDTATVTVTVTPGNEAPVATDDTASLDEDGTILIDVLDNDSDADGNTLTITDVTGAANGTAIIEAGQIRYTPNAGFSGSETLTYTIDDGSGGTDTATVSVTVIQGNDAPIAVNDSANLDEDGTVLIDVLANDSDPDGDALSITGVVGATNGTAVIENGQIRYTPTSGFSGTDTINYTISDGAGGTASASVSIQVNAAPTGAPIVVDDYVTIVSGGTILIDALANDSDPEGGQIYISSVAPTIAKSIQFVDGKVQYEALDNYTGVVEMDYTVSDFDGNSTTGTVFIDIVAPNTGPIANDDTASLSENESVLIDVLANDDAGGGTVSIASITAALNGTAVIENGQIRYTPNTDFSGSDTISYTISDGNGGEATASVQIDVAELVDGAPIVVDDYVTVESGGTILIDALANDSDPNGDGIYISSIAPTIAQSLQFVNGQIQYEALANYTGVVEMEYTVTDYGGTSSTGSVFIDVVAPGSIPAAAATAAAPIEVTGTSGNNILTSTEADEVFTGGAGADFFVFNALEAEGIDRITDFELGVDTIEMVGNTYADLTFVDTGSGARVEWDNGSVELDNIAVASLTEDQFLFV